MKRGISTLLITILLLVPIGIYAFAEVRTQMVVTAASELEDMHKQIQNDLIATIHQMQEELRELDSELTKTRMALKEERAIVAGYEAAKGWKVTRGVATAYSPYDSKTGIDHDGNPNKTSTGSKPSRGTVAVDPKRIPYGSEIIIKYDDGSVEVGSAKDTGGAMRNAKGILIDVYRDTHAQATKHGRKDALIFWKEKEDN